ncbi:tryptophan 2,3-dioxygenase [Modestobacter sp. VKM Ac-2984]|uniref:tryptophan 2,3-dioxygenase n=1 Tax=Modestobacter sp. VKM Ac-2984 TaxID=3004138 RepID=UPI0022AA03A8|nr:tryptophan 2,3-dioxygenase family protein [Modestobacter sp. VKM Ac-2984]MCZ2815587.1 tryptophan 2,3-dioxygenase family protein [Modestobacter sp. VKM Ac-2984]
MTTRQSPSAPAPLDAGTRAARAAGNAGQPTVEFAEATPYEQYVGVRQLQALVRPVTEHPAEPAFLVVTQVMELWFTLLRREWELAQQQLRADDLDAAIGSIRRSVHHLRSLDASWGSLLWLTPAEFNGFRDQLGEASGFQSYEYRHVEFLLGLKAESVVRPHRGLPVVHADLQRALAAPSLEDDVLAYLARRGLPVPATVLERDRTVTHEPDPAVTALWAEVYTDPRPGNELFTLGEALTDVAEVFTTWRQRHVTAVRRAMGAKPGSGGSAGLAWLERSAARVVFPDLWAARTVV